MSASRGADWSADVIVLDAPSAFQPGARRIRAVVPTRLAPGERLPCVYVLPVEAGREARYGDGLRSVVAERLHEVARVVVVAPDFAQLPWYADHPTNPAIRQESHLLRVVVPTVERALPVRTDGASRWLLGFSKSGWGAFSLLLRHPEAFGKAVAWDAPLMMDRPGPYGSGPILGTPANFERYHVARLLEARARELTGPPRLFHMGEGNFRAEHWRAEALMDRLGIAHGFVNGPTRPHHWDSGWLPQAVSLLRHGV